MNMKNVSLFALLFVVGLMKADVELTKDVELTEEEAVYSEMTALGKKLAENETFQEWMKAMSDLNISQHNFLNVRNKCEQESNCNQSDEFKKALRGLNKISIDVIRLSKETEEIAEMRALVELKKKCQ